MKFCAMSAEPFFCFFKRPYLRIYWLCEKLIIFFNNVNKFLFLIEKKVILNFKSDLSGLGSHVSKGRQFFPLLKCHRNRKMSVMFKSYEVFVLWTTLVSCVFIENSLFFKIINVMRLHGNLPTYSYAQYWYGYAPRLMIEQQVCISFISILFNISKKYQQNETKLTAKVCIWSNFSFKLKF